MDYVGYATHLVDGGAASAAWDAFTRVDSRRAALLEREIGRARIRKLLLSHDPVSDEGTRLLAAFR
jgi:hypothetical protein